MRSMPDEERPSGDPYYIQASSVAADRPKLVLKHNETFLVADSRGDFPDMRASSASTWTAPGSWVWSRSRLTETGTVSERSAQAQAAPRSQSSARAPRLCRVPDRSDDVDDHDRRGGTSTREGGR